MRIDIVPPKVPILISNVLRKLVLWSLSYHVKYILFIIHNFLREICNAKHFTMYSFSRWFDCENPVVGGGKRHVLSLWWGKISSIMNKTVLRISLILALKFFYFFTYAMWSVMQEKFKDFLNSFFESFYWYVKAMFWGVQLRLLSMLEDYNFNRHEREDEKQRIRVTSTSRTNCHVHFFYALFAQLHWFFLVPALLVLY